jgi:flagellum-specific ATP synthase
MSHVVPREHLRAAAKLRDALATYQRSSDLIQLGAYVSGTNPKLDVAMRTREKMLDFLRQDAHEISSLTETTGRLQAIAGELSA